VRTLPFIFSDVVWTNRDGFVYIGNMLALPSVVAAYVFDGDDLRVLWQVDCETRLWYVRAVANPAGDIQVAAQAGAGLMTVRVLAGEKPEFDLKSNVPCFGQNCALATWNGAEFVAFSQTSTTSYVRVTDRGVSDPIPCRMTSQGWIDGRSGLADDGSQDELQWTDQNRQKRVAGLEMFFPVERGGVTVGQGASGGFVGVSMARTFALDMSIACYEPHLAVNDALDQWAACCRSAGFTAAFTMPPFPAMPVPNPGPIVPEPGTPEPPPVEPPAMETPNILADIEAERLKYGPKMTNAQCAEMLNAVAFRNPGFGLLKKEGGNHAVRFDGARVSVDHLTYLPNGTTDDVLLDAGDDGDGKTIPIWGEWEPYNDGQYVAPIQPQGTNPPPPVTPPVTPPTVPPPVTQPTCDLGPVLVKLAEMIDADVDLVMAVSEQNKELARMSNTLDRVLNELETIRLRQDRSMIGRLSSRFVSGDITLVPRS
jgi:hypothetical protein